MPITGGESPWQDIFDGKSLDGWRTEGRATWAVSDGAIHGEGALAGYLFTKREFADFELQADVKIDSHGNSGVFFRSYPNVGNTYEVKVIGSAVRQPNGWRFTGDICEHANWLGSTLAKVSENVIRDDQWFHLNLSASGSHIVVKFDDKSVLDFVDPKNSFTHGSIGLEYGHPGTQVFYKNIRVRALDGAPSSSTGVLSEHGAGSEPQISDPKSVTPPMAVAPFDAEKAKARQAAWAKYLGVDAETTNSIGMKLVVIPPGEFTMGSSKEVIAAEIGANSDAWYTGYVKDEGPPHRVRITKPFWMGSTPVTVEQYCAVIGRNPDDQRSLRRREHLVERCSRVLQEVGREGREGVSLADGSRVGIRMPCRQHLEVVLW